MTVQGQPIHKKGQSRCLKDFFQYRGRFGKYLLAAVFLTLSTLPALPVEIPDPALEGAIRDALGKPTGEITQADMETLTSLQAEGLNIANLSGLEAAVNLTSLTFGITKSRISAP